MKLIVGNYALSDTPVALHVGSRVAIAALGVILRDDRSHDTEITVLDEVVLIEPTERRTGPSSRPVVSSSRVGLGSISQGA
jgi:hypothetical protein